MTHQSWCQYERALYRYSPRLSLCGEWHQKFLEVAAQSNGKILNYAKIARDAAIDPKQVERYFPILSETLIGVFLEPYDRSVRKRQSQKSKFYFFDPGVKHSIAGIETIDRHSNLSTGKNF